MQVASLSVFFRAVVFSIVLVAPFSPAFASTIVVPDVVGEGRIQAQRTLLFAGLRVGSRTEVYHASVPFGYIISQNPIAGATVTSGTAVNIEISLGVPNSDIPNVVGMTQADAEAAIVAAGLVVRWVFNQHDPVVPAGHVISQSPEACTACASDGDRVDLVISIGPPPPIDVPDVTSEKLSAAELEITRADLVVGAITYQPSESVPAGYIISQNPSACTNCVPPGSAVDLTVATSSDGAMSLVKVTRASENGETDEVSVTSGDWHYDPSAQMLTLNGNQLLTYPVSPTTTLFLHSFNDATMNLAAGTIGASLFDCAEGSFGPIVRANICGNYSFGADEVEDSSVDYSTIPATRSIGGDDVVFGPQVQLADYAGSVGYYDGVTLIVNTLDWNGTTPASGNGDRGYQLEFEHQVAIDVPDFTGMTQASAEAAIVAAFLTVGAVTQQEDTIVPAGQVISHNPAACSDCASPDDPVDLVISTGPPVTVDVPDVIGQPQSTAETMIVAAGLAVGSVTPVLDAVVPAGNVISQNPTACLSCAELNDPVDLVISGGPQGVPVPNVVGMGRISAQWSLLIAGFNVGAVNNAHSSTVPAGFVISQNPVGLSLAAPGSAIDLVISLGSE